MNYNKVNEYEQNILKKKTQQYNDETKGDSDSEDIDIDELINDLEDEADDNDVFVRYREQRLQEISNHIRKVEDHVKFGNYGILDTINDESKLIKMSSEINKIVIHFQMETFTKCRYMNERLKTLAQRYLTIKFVNINVEDCPFLVKKLNIKVLPFVIGYKKGQEVMRLIGFSKLGNNANEFPIENLETQLRISGLLDFSLSNNSDAFRREDDSGSDLDI